MQQRGEEDPAERLPAGTGEERILRDYLAADRTTLANERTLMAYVRTALAFGAAGVTALHFVGGPVYNTLGGVSIVAGVLTFATGVVRFLSYRRRIEASVRGSRPR